MLPGQELSVARTQPRGASQRRLPRLPFADSCLSSIRLRLFSTTQSQPRYKIDYFTIFYTLYLEKDHFAATPVRETP